jgi:hypothetical protein
MHRRIFVAAIAVAVLGLATGVPAANAGLVDRVGGTLDGATAGLGDGSGEADLVLGGKPCKLIPVAPAQARPIGIGPCPGVRPGAAVLSDLGQCTFNFLFTGSDGQRYIGTAGHCILDGGEESWAPGTGPEARDGSGERIGEFAYAILDSPKDFALIRLDPGVDADPAICHFGGPTEVNDGNPGPMPPTLLHHFGAGLAVGDVLPGRSAVAAGMPDPDHVFANGVVIFGDSGSGVISADGGAVGVVVTVGAHAGSIGTGGVHAGTVGITRLPPQVSQAEQVLGIALALETAPLS